MKRSLAILVTLVMAATVLLSACNGGNSASSAPASPAPESQSAAPAAEASSEAPADAGGEALTLEFMHTRTEEDISNSAEGTIFKQHLDEWIAAHPNVTINQSTMNQTDYQTKITALSAADDMPDIYFTKGSWVGNFYRNGVMADITSYVSESEYRPGIFEPFKRDGKIYAIPYQCNVTHLIFYNEEMWAAAGFDTFPDNWADIDKAKEYFDSQGIVTFAFGNMDKWNSESCIISALGDRFTGTAWTKSIINNDGNAKFTDPEFIETLTFLQGMTKYFNPDFNAITHQQAAAMYLSEKAAGGIDGIWNVSHLINNDTNGIVDKTKIAVMPAVEGGKGDPLTTSGGPVWSTSASSKLEGTALDTAVGLILTLYSKEYSQYIMDNAGQVGIHIVEPTDPDSLAPIAQSALACVNSLNSLVPIYDGEMEASVIEIMNSNLQSMLGGGISPEEVAALIQAEQEKISA